MLDSEFLPASVAGSARVLVMLHGLGDSSQGYTWLPEALRLPWLNYLLVNAPDPYYGGGSWYDFERDMRPGVRRSRELLFATLDELRARGFPSEQTVLSGFSQGCVMAMEVGCRYPHRLAGVFGISGYLCEPEVLVRELSPVAREQRFVVTHGRWDPLLPIERARQHMALLKATGCQLTWHEFDKEHTICPEEIVLLRQFAQAIAPA